MNESAVACIDANMRYRDATVPEEQQVAGMQQGQLHRHGVPVLSPCGAGYPYTGLSIGIIDQATAIEAVQAGAAVAVGGANQCCGDAEPRVRVHLRPAVRGFCRLQGGIGGAARQLLQQQENTECAQLPPARLTGAGTHMRTWMNKSGTLYIGRVVAGLNR